MDQRAEEILEKVIEYYIENAEPIGSRLLSKALDKKLSPATIRNVMTDLTEMGYIVQPHTSAGRVPTDAAYRYYIDKLFEEISTPWKEMFQRRLEMDENHPHHRIEDILLDATNELSTITNCAGIVISPMLSASRLKQIQLIRLNSRQILVVIVTQIGMVHNKIIQVRSCPNQDNLDKMAAILLDLFEKEPIAKIRKSLIKELTKNKEECNQLIIQAIRLGKKAFDIESPGELFISGRSKMCSFPEFNDQKKLKDLYRVFEDKIALTDMMIEAMNDDGIKVNIGTENRLMGLSTCSVVAGTYGNQGHLLGTIGVVGPTRLNYPKVISAIHYSTEKLSLSLSRFLEGY